MGAEKLREKLYLLIDSADEKLLRMLVALGDVYGEEFETVGKDIPMNPIYDKLTAESIKSRLKESRMQSENGEVHTSEELRTMIKERK